MDLHNLVVARFQDGKVLKGMTNDFSPLRPTVHIEISQSHDVLELRLKQLKALFFVKTFEGDSDRQDLLGFVQGPAETAQGRKIAVRFRDGEFMCGYTMSWTPDRDGFFLFPADANSNNQRVFVITAATAEVKAGPMAEALAQRVLAARTAGPPAVASSGPTLMPRAQAPGAAPPSGGTLGPRTPRPGGY